MGAVSYVSSSILVVGKVFISSVTTLLSYMALIDAEAELHHVAGPLVVIFFISYIVSDQFMDVFDVSIRTILHCFCADEEMFDGVFAEGAIVRFIEQYQDPDPVGVPVKRSAKKKTQARTRSSQKQ